MVKCRAIFVCFVVKSKYCMFRFVGVNPRNIPWCIFDISSFPSLTPGVLTYTKLPNTRRCNRFGLSLVQAWNGEMLSFNDVCGSLFFMYTAWSNASLQYSLPRCAPFSMARITFARLLWFLSTMPFWKLESGAHVSRRNPASFITSLNFELLHYFYLHTCLEIN